MTPTHPPVAEEPDILDRLCRIETLLSSLVERGVAKDWYSVDEFAAAAGLRPFTIREHCRLGRLAGVKKASGRGKHLAWVLSHAELLRFRQYGLLTGR